MDFSRIEKRGIKTGRLRALNIIKKELEKEKKSAIKGGETARKRGETTDDKDIIALTKEWENRADAQVIVLDRLLKLVNSEIQTAEVD